MTIGNISHSIPRVAVLTALLCLAFGLIAQVVPADWEEIEELRTEHSRTFKDAAGSYHLQQTAGAFHYPSSEGQWRPIQQHLTTFSEGEFGLYETRLPIAINVNSGLTKLSLDESQGSISYGEFASLQLLDGAFGVINEVSATPGDAEVSPSQIILHSVFPGVSRVQEVAYWSMRTDYVLHERPSIPPAAIWLAVADRLSLPSGWQLVPGEGEWEGESWRGSMEVLNESGEFKALFSPPQYYDAEGKAVAGLYSWSLSPGGYDLRLLVPAAWLVSEETIYPVVLDPTVSNTYGLIQGVQDYLNQFNANCQATMDLALPAGPSLQVTNTSTQYTIQSKGNIVTSGFTTYYAAGFEQRSRVGFGNNFTPVQNGFGNSQAIQNVPYNIANSAIANGCYPGGTVLTYRWQGYQTFFPVAGGPALAAVAGCTTLYHQLQANTWVVTVTYNVFNLTVNTNPSTVNICSGSNAQVSLTSTPGGATYAWTVQQNGITGASNGAGNTINQVLFGLGQAPGTAVYTITPTLNGCQGTPANVTATVNPIFTDTEIFAGICAGESYLFGGTNYSTPGEYPVVFQTQAGCDSIVTLYLELLPALNTTVNASICDGESFAFNGSNYSSSGQYLAELISANGCDSLVTLNLTVNPVYSISFSESICQGQTYFYDGNAYTTSGSYPIMYQSFHGCDSLMTLHLTVDPAFTQTFNASICQGSSYTFEGSSYSQPGQYSVTYQTAAGCDSVVVLNLSVNPVSFASLQATVCQGESYVLNGVAYNQAGNYQQIYQTAAGCDSIIALQLTVLPVYNVLHNETICEGEVFFLDGFAFAQTGTYVREMTTAAGCDSIVTLNLTVYPLPVVDIGDVYTICAGENVTLTGPSGTSGNLIWNTGQAGSSITVSQPGDYSLTLVTPQGCVGSDEATVFVMPSPEPVMNTDYVFCSGDRVELDAGNPGCTYLWSTGATSQTIEAGQAGFYTVLITNPQGCQRSAFAQLVEYCEPVIYVPNSFTPDHDGINDYFRAYGENVAGFEMTIFNRWGEPVFHSEDIEEGWDGSFLGGDHYAQDQVASWVIRYKVFADLVGRQTGWRILKGHVLIMR